MSEYKTMLQEFCELRQLEKQGLVVLQEWERLQIQYGAIVDRYTIDQYLEDQNGGRS